MQRAGRNELNSLNCRILARFINSGSFIQNRSYFLGTKILAYNALSNNLQASLNINNLRVIFLLNMLKFSGDTIKVYNLYA